MELKAHDLLTFHHANQLVSKSPMPHWVMAAIESVPMVVVRRAPQVDHMVPVGIRGWNRNQRFAAYLPFESIEERITPIDLAKKASWRNHPKIKIYQVLQALDVVNEFFVSQNIAWGPTGSVGFELASGVSAVKETSDLDLMIRMFHPFSVEYARELLYIQSQIPVKIDIQVETQKGAFILTDYAQGSKVLLRTNTGPYIVNDPWSG